jgi:hypothetical protein
MLFNSFPFLLMFLPVTLAGIFYAPPGGSGRRRAAGGARIERAAGQDDAGGELSGSLMREIG